MKYAHCISTLLVSFLATAIAPAYAQTLIDVETTRPAASAPADESARYSQPTEHDPNGIGKFYMGREIAQVMGHQAADWLERPEREQEESPSKLISALRLRSGDVVADIGAGTGYYTTRLAKIVAPGGRIKAVDIQQEMLDLLKKKLIEGKIENVDLILGEESDPRLEPDSVDLVLMVDVYHELAFPFEMMQRVVRSLKSDGRVVLVEFRLEDPNVPIKLVHKMSEIQAIKEMKAVGLRHKETIETLPWQHILIFENHPRACSSPASSPTP
jgi:ubiquinone/menaquinone biosynthesis C-methylase UbiE